MKGFACAGFGSGFQRDCGQVVDEHHAGLLLNPPKGWKPVGPSRRRHHGPLYPDKVLTHLDFNRDDPDELWLLGLTDLETN